MLKTLIALPFETSWKDFFRKNNCFFFFSSCWIICSCIPLSQGGGIKKGGQNPPEYLDQMEVPYPQVDFDHRPLKLNL